MPEEIKKFIEMINGQMKGNWKPEFIQVKHRDSEWVVKMNTSEVGFVFSETGQFKYCYNWKE